MTDLFNFFFSFYHCGENKCAHIYGFEEFCHRENVRCEQYYLYHSVQRKMANGNYAKISLKAIMLPWHSTVEV
jgi:hypothetical protein